MDSTKQSGGGGGGGAGGATDFLLLILPALLRSSPLAAPLLQFAAAVAAAAILAAAIFRWAATPGGCAWWSTAATAPPPPGPRGLPIIGSLLSMGSLAHRRLAALAAAHGAKSLMSLSLGSTRLIVSSDPSSAREILNSFAFADRPLKQSAQQLLFGRAIGFAPYGDYWRRLRRIAANHLFSPKRIAAHEGRRQAEASAMLDSISRAAAAVHALEIRPFLQHASLNNIMQSVFGRRYEFLDANVEAMELQSMVREGFDLLGAFNWADHLPQLRCIDPQAIHERCSLLVPRVSEFVRNVIDQHRRSPLHGESNDSCADFVDVLLGFRGDDALEDADMIAVLWEMIFRGTDTTAILCEWILAELVLHPEIQASLHEEICHSIKNSSSSSRSDQAIAESEIAKLPLLNAVIKETLRMHPPGPLLSWARLATEDVQISGHSIPKGTTAMVNMWSIAHDASIWSNPQEFSPWRFMAGGEAGPDFDIKGTDLRLAPFGAGRRVCPGRALGIATVNLWLARLIHRFEFVAHPDEAVDLSEVLKLSCEMIKPLKVVPIERVH